MSVDATGASSESDKLVFSLRNEAAPPFDALGYIELGVNVQRSPERVAHKTEVRAAQLDDSARVLSLGRGATSGYEPERPKMPHTGLLGSFANGPKAIWREVPADPETGRPAYYHSETLNLSQWHRPKAPNLKPLQHQANDLQSISPRYQGLEPHERVKLIIGEMEFRPPREPTAAELEEQWAQEQIAKMQREAEEAEQEEGFDAANGGNGGANTDGADGGADGARRMPLLSATSRMLNPGEALPKLRSQPTAEERQIMREAAKAEKEAEQAKRQYAERVQKADEDYERTVRTIYTDAERAREEEAKKAAEERRKAAAAAELEAKMFAAKKSKGGGNKGGGAPAAAAADGKNGAAAGKKDSMAAPKNPDPRKQPKPMPTPLVVLERQVKEKCQELRENDEERRRMMRDVAYAKRVEEEERRSAPGFKDFDFINQAKLPEFAPIRKAERGEERRRQRQAMSSEAQSRHAELLKREAAERYEAAAAKGRVPSPEQFRMMTGSGGLATPRMDHGGEEAEEGTPRVSTLSQPPGSMYNAETAKGRARRLAAQLAKAR